MKGSIRKGLTAIALATVMLFGAQALADTVIFETSPNLRQIERYRKIEALAGDTISSTQRNYLAITTSLGGTLLLGFLGFMILKVGRSNWHVFRSDPGAHADVSRTIESCSPCKTAEDLGERICKALKFGNFRNYLGLFPTPLETRQMFSSEFNAEYWQGARDDQFIRQHFDALRRPLDEHQLRPISVHLRGLRFGTSDKGNLVEVAEAKLRCLSHDDAPVTFPLGRVVRIEGGWRLMVPQMPDEESSQETHVVFETAVAPA